MLTNLLCSPLTMPIDDAALRKLQSYQAEVYTAQDAVDLALLAHNGATTVLAAQEASHALQDAQITLASVQKSRDVLLSNVVPKLAPALLSIFTTHNIPHPPPDTVFTLLSSDRFALFGSVFTPADDSLTETHILAIFETRNLWRQLHPLRPIMADVPVDTYWALPSRVAECAHLGAVLDLVEDELKVSDGVFIMAIDTWRGSRTRSDTEASSLIPQLSGLKIF
ncbi:hypothetical protein MKEN_00517100 [Mycena kentingensis (nom. inval.)]|nr:hypothetical protein MKEN_00517100 [Mycena kentingensis (nom. inval.)]